MLELGNLRVDRTIFEAAVVHDYCYGETYPKFTRLQADDIFLAAMETAKVAWLTRTLAYRTCRGFGLKAWETGVNQYMEADEIIY